MSLSQPGAVQSAVRNNAAWCDAVCSAAGGRCEWQPSYWLNRARSPRFYPNLVTLGEDVGAPLDALQGLCASAAPAPDFGVKDSYARLDLAPLGFAPLFDAQWLCLEAHPPAAVDTTLDWHTVDSAPGLRAWEAAWGEADPARAEPVFGPALLDDPAACFVAGARDGVIVCGAAAYSSDGVVGLTNCFQHAAAPAGALALTVLMIAQRFSGSALVGYETDEALAAMRAIGFRPIGALRVWVRRLS